MFPSKHCNAEERRKKQKRERQVRIERERERQKNKEREREREREIPARPEAERINDTPILSQSGPHYPMLHMGPWGAYLHANHKEMINITSRARTSLQLYENRNLSLNKDIQRSTKKKKHTCKHKKHTHSTYEGKTQSESEPRAACTVVCRQCPTHAVCGRQSTTV